MPDLSVTRGFRLEKNADAGPTQLSTALVEMLHDAGLTFGEVMRLRNQFSLIDF
jgi:hypothetical protein